MEVSNSTTRGENMQWNEQQTGFLVTQVLELEKTPGMMSGGDLKTKAYTMLEKKLIDTFGPAFTKDKIRNKLRLMKRDVAVCKELLNTSGFGWDPNTKCIDVDNNVWAEYIIKYPQRRKFRTPKVWKHFEDLGEILGQSRANDNKHNAESLANLCAEESVDLEFDQFSLDNSQSFTQMLNCESPQGQENSSRTPNTGYPSQTPSNDNPTQTFGSDNLTQTSSTSNPPAKKQKVNLDDAVRRMLGVLIDKVSGLYDDSRTKQFNECASILREMRDTGEIDDQMLVLAFDVLADKKWPVVFLNLDPQTRVSWLLHKVSQL